MISQMMVEYTHIWNLYQLSVIIAANSIILKIEKLFFFF